MNFNWSILYILQVFTQSHKQTSKTMIPLFFTCFSSHEVRINEKYYSHFSLIKNFWQPSDNFTHKYSSKRQNQNIFNHSQREFNYVKTVMTLSCRERNGYFGTFRCKKRDVAVAHFSRTFPLYILVALDDVTSLTLTCPTNESRN